MTTGSFWISPRASRDHLPEVEHDDRSATDNSRVSCRVRSRARSHPTVRHPADQLARSPSQPGWFCGGSSRSNTSGSYEGPRDLETPASRGKRARSSFAFCVRPTNFKAQRLRALVLLAPVEANRSMAPRARCAAWTRPYLHVLEGRQRSGTSGGLEVLATPSRFTCRACAHEVDGVPVLP